MVYPPAVPRKRNLFVILVVLAAGTTMGCDRPPSDGIREWSPQDHDHDEQQQGGQAPTSEDKRAMIIEAAWQQNCAACHGPIGHGDGPNGALVKAPDLTRADWQEKVSDKDIADRIRQGKGLMPKFDLPEETIAGLVARVRASRGH